MISTYRIRYFFSMRNIAALLALLMGVSILFLAFTATLIYDTNPSQQNRLLSHNSLIALDDIIASNVIELANQNTKLQFKLQHDLWYLHYPTTHFIQESFLKSFFLILTNLKISEVISLNTETIEKYSLNNPDVTIRLQSQNKNNIKLIKLSSSPHDKDTTYATLSGEDQIFILKLNLHSLTEINLPNILSANPLQFHENKIKKIELIKENMSVVQLVKTDGKWFRNTNKELSPKVVQVFFSKLGDLQPLTSENTIESSIDIIQMRVLYESQFMVTYKIEELAINNKKAFRLTNDFTHEVHILSKGIFNNQSIENYLISL